VTHRDLNQRADELPLSPDGVRESLGTRYADALVSIMQDALDRDAPESGAAPAVTVFVDADLAGPTQGAASAVTAGNGLRVGPATLEELLCTGCVSVVGVRDGRPVTVTPTTRAIPLSIRDLVLHRDGGCTIDGCASRYRLQPHHIDAYASGGGHDPDNLTTLCWYHHHVVVHERGYSIDAASPPQRRRLPPPQDGDP
jgi:HNH endonuclease